MNEPIRITSVEDGRLHPVVTEWLKLPDTDAKKPALSRIIARDPLLLAQLVSTRIATADHPHREPSASLYEAIRKAASQNIPTSSREPRIRKSAGYRRVWAVAALIPVLAGGFLIIREFSSSESTTPVITAQPLRARLTLATGTVKVNGTIVKSGTDLSAGDVLETGRSPSIAIVQFGGSASLTLKSKARVTMDMLQQRHGKPEVMVAQNKGFSFSRIRKGEALYALKTPTAVAGVRGTEFAVDIAPDGKESIFVREGTVALMAADTPPAQAISETVIDARTGAITTRKVLIQESQSVTREASTDPQTVQPKPLNQKQKANLDKLASLEATQPGITDVSPEQLNATISTMKEPEGYAMKVISVTPSLESLREKYGRLAVIQLRDGRSFTGAFRADGNEMEIITPEETVRVPVSLIRIIDEH